MALWVASRRSEKPLQCSGILPTNGSQLMVRILAATLLACAISGHAQQYDLVLRNGQVLDPKNNVAAKRDVAVLDGKIAAIEPTIPSSAAKQSVDISGLYLTPGLVDIHVHVFTGLRHNAWGNGDLSVPARASCARETSAPTSFACQRRY